MGQRESKEATLTSCQLASDMHPNKINKNKEATEVKRKIRGETFCVPGACKVLAGDVQWPGAASI